MKRILIDAGQKKIRTALMEDGRLVEILIDKGEDASIVGRIILGTVKNILPSQFAFIDIGCEKNAFMNLGGADDLKPGRPALVQVYKDASGTKGACVGRKLHLNGRFVILYGEGAGECGVSQKIADSSERKRLKKILRGSVPPGFGAIARTACEGRSEDEVRLEIERLAALHGTIQKSARGLRPPAVIFRENPCVLELLSGDVDEIIVNDRKMYEAVTEAVASWSPEFTGRIMLYGESESRSLFDAHGVENKIDAALCKTIRLGCGGFATFEQTEACVIIDVNTGSFAGKKNYRETVLQTNLEAASCVAEQMRLRNLSGMIIVDFIDMKEDADKRELIGALKESIARDRIKTSIVGMTELGFVQLTRRKTREPLGRLLEQDCPRCGGSGKIKISEE